ncbi:MULTISPECIES: hypothetical protein [unclassified Halobacteriovorax]|uniref:hypothetical protein n=1 Tax=unclassified Halobacteriovorax TaxID=2639665 RepID=UPI00399BCE45
MSKLLILFLFSLNILAISDSVKSAIDIDSVEKLAKHKYEELSSSSRDRAGQTPLIYALHKRKLNVAKYLITRKLGVNAKDYISRSPITIALSKFDDLELIELFMANGVDLKVKDKHQRDIFYYLEKNSNESIKKFIKAEYKKIQDVSISQIDELKSSLVNGESKKLEQYLSKYRTINIKINNTSVLDFLIKSNSLNKWSMSYLASLGLDVFETGFIYQLIITKNFEAYKELSNYRTNIISGPKGESLLEIALKNDAPDDILLNIIKKQKDLKIKDIEGNSYLHLAIIKNRPLIVDSLIKRGLKLSLRNRNGDTALMLIIDNFDNANAENYIKDNLDLINIQNNDGTDAVIKLAKYKPELLNSILKELKGKYDFTHVDKFGNRAVVLADVTTPRANPAEVGATLNELPRVDSAQLNTPNLNADIKTVDQVAKDLNSIDSYIGDRLFDRFVNDNVDAYIAKSVSNFKSHILKLKSVEDEDFSFALKEIEDLKSNLRNTQNSLNAIKLKKIETVASYQKLKASLDGFDSEGFNRTINSSVSQLKGELSNIINFVNDVNFELKEFSSHRNELEGVLKQFKEGKDKISLEIDIVRQEFTQTKKQLLASIEETKFYYSGELLSLESNVRHEKGKLDHAKSNLDEDDKLIRQANANIASAVWSKEDYKRRENHPGHDPNTCQWTTKRRAMVKRIEELDKQIENLNEKRRRSNRIFNDMLKNYNFTKNEYAKFKAFSSQKIQEFRTKINNEIKLKENNVRNELAALEYGRDLEFDDVRIEVEGLKNEIEKRFGDISSVENTWNNLYSSVQKLNSIASLKDAMRCGMLGCAPSILLPDNGTKLAKDFNDKVMSLSLKYASYSSVYDSQHTYRYQVNNLDKMALEIENLKTQEASLLDSARIISNDIVLKSKELKEIKSPDNQVLNELISIEELVFKNQFLKTTVEVNASERSELKDELGIDRELTVESLIVKEEHKYAPLVINSISLNFENLETLESYSKENIPSLLGQWFDILATNMKDSQGLYTIEGRDLFIRSLKDKVTIEKVTDGELTSVKILTSYGDFVVDESGMPISVDEEDKSPLDFELTSTGIVRERILEVISKFRKIYPDAKMEDLKQNQNLSIIVSLLKMADQINDAKRAEEIIDVIFVIANPILHAVPGGPVVAKSLGMLKCSYEYFNRIRLGIHTSSLEDGTRIVSCLSDVILSIPFSKQFKGQLSSFFDDVIPSKLLVNLTKTIFGTGADKLFSVKSIEILFEGIFGLAVSDLNEKLFVENGNVFKNIVSSYHFYDSGVSFNGETEIVKAGLKFKALEMLLTSNFNGSVYIINRSLKILNVCNYSKSQITEKVSESLDVKISTVELNPSVVLNKGDSSYLIKGSLCLLVID